MKNLLHQFNISSWNTQYIIAKNAKNKKKKAKEKEARIRREVSSSRMRANWFCETDAKEMNAITVSNLYILRTAIFIRRRRRCSQKTLPHLRIIPRVPDLSCVFREIHILRGIRSQRIGNPIEHIIMMLCNL